METASRELAAARESHEMTCAGTGRGSRSAHAGSATERARAARRRGGEGKGEHGAWARWYDAGMTRVDGPRFCVVGAGAAGISAADALRRRGHRSITVLEKDPARVGGKCRTVPFEGAPVDTGAI